MAAQRAVIFIPHRREQDRWERACLNDIDNAGDRLVGMVVVGRDGQSWADAQSMLDHDRADVIVVGRRDHIPPDALPNVRVAAEERAPGRRRPRVIE